MALITPNAAPDTRLAFLSGLADFISQPAPRKISEWQVYDLGLQDIVGAAGIGGAAFTAWRFLTANAAGQPLVAGVIPKPAGAWLMTSLAQGPQFAGKFQSAVAQVAALPEVRAADYEARVLRIPGLLIEAFWLVSQSGGTDWVVPFLTLANQLQVSRPYSVTDFSNIIRPLAVTRLTFDDTQFGAGS